MDPRLVPMKWNGADLAMMVGIGMVLAATSGLSLFLLDISREAATYGHGYRDGYTYATRVLSGKRAS